MGLVSVIIPSHNRASVLPRAVKSVLDQSYCDMEVLVVDDGSTDNTAEVIESIKDTRVRYIKRERNSGPGAARNTGLRAARGDYVAFLDSDDEWLPQKLEKQIALLESLPAHVALCYTGCKYVKNGNRTAYFIPDSKFDGTSDILKTYILEGQPTHTPTCVVRKSCLDQIGTFDESLIRLEDQDFFTRIFMQYTAVAIPEWLVIVHRDTWKPVSKASIPARKAVLKKHYATIVRRLGRQAGNNYRGQMAWANANDFFREGRFLQGAWHFAEAVACVEPLYHQDPISGQLVLQ